jgi:hypothetical protein
MLSGKVRSDVSMGPLCLHMSIVAINTIEGNIFIIEMRYVSCGVRTDVVSLLQRNVAKMLPLRACPSESSSFPL